MSHGLPTGDYNVPLIGGAAPHETTPGYFTGLFARNTPEFQRALRAVRREVRRWVDSVTYKGRPNAVKLSPGAWVTDLAELRKAILLCWACAPKFDHVAYGYHKDRRWQTETGGTLGVCDGCRADGQLKKQLYIHESLVGKGPGQSHIPDPGNHV